MKDKERKRLWELVTARDGKTCVICKSAPATALEHIWPRALGGTDHEYNLQPACKPCNSKKRCQIPAVLPLFVEGDPWALYEEYWVTQRRSSQIWSEMSRGRLTRAGLGAWLAERQAAGSG